MRPGIGTANLERLTINLPEDRRKWTSSCRREKPEFSLMLLVGSKVSDFDPGISLRKPLSFLMPNVFAQECYLTRTGAWQNLRFQKSAEGGPALSRRNLWLV